VLFGLGRVAPDEFAVEMPGFDVDIEGQRFHRDEALQGVHLRADRKGVEIVAVRADAADHLGIAGAGLVAHAGDQSARLLDADRFDQLTANGAERRVVEQHHAPVVEPDFAPGRDETQARGEIVDVRQAMLVVGARAQQTNAFIQR
jgi:hypothetical protein